LMQALVLAVGLPFFALAGCAPLLQLWFARGTERDPYFLYAASNGGSFAALILYPILVEPNLTLRRQAHWWKVGYGALALLSLLCVACLFRGNKAVAAPGFSPGSGSILKIAASLSWRARLRWLLLALVPSRLMLTFTTYLTTDIAPIPLLWVMPLGIY